MVLMYVEERDLRLHVLGPSTKGLKATEGT